MLMEAQKSALLIVDMQEKLVPLIPKSHALIENCSWLMQIANKFEIPTLVVEQYPEGLGKTVVQLSYLGHEEYVLDKVHFSCARDKKILSAINALRRDQLIIAGLETHVCILQTAIDLSAMGKKVHVVADAVASRHEEDHRVGLERMRGSGVEIITREMALFEWAEHSDSPLFKELSLRYLKTQVVV